MAAKFQVFVSSTFEDLKAEREQVIKAILEMGHIPVGMEMFSAGDEEQWNIITRHIDEIDYYAVIVGHRYGSITDTGIGYTEKEYDYAISKGVPVLGFLLDDKASWPADKIETDEKKRERLDQFRTKVRSRMVNFWANKDDLHAKFSIALMKAFSTHPRAGWTRASDVAGPEVTKEISRLSAENAELRKNLQALQLKDREQTKDEITEAYRILMKPQLFAYVRKAGESDWGKEIKTDLFTIFEGIAPKLLVENHMHEMVRDAAFAITGKIDYHLNWPIPENHFRDWIADLHALDLIEPSKKKHTVQDTKEYWTLTELGRAGMKDFRRFKLKSMQSQAKTENVSE